MLGLLFEINGDPLLIQNFPNHDISMGVMMHIHIAHDTSAMIREVPNRYRSILMDICFENESFRKHCLCFQSQLRASIFFTQT